MTKLNLVLWIGALVVAAVVALWAFQSPQRESVPATAPTAMNPPEKQQDDEIAEQAFDWDVLRALVEQAEVRQLASAGDESTSSLLEQSQGLLERAPQGAQSAYWESRIALLQATQARSEEDERQTVTHLEHAQRAAERAFALDNTLSDAYWVFADALSQLIPYKGLFFAATASHRASQADHKALALDPNNVRAHLNLGQQALFSPAIAGGSVDKALAQFQQALRLADTDPERFLATVWLGQAWHAKDNAGQAQAAFEAALKIYPFSAWAKGLLAGLGSQP